MTGPAILALVRHGESAWIAEGRFQGRGDPPLSDTGMSQAAAIGARLAAPAATPQTPVPDSAPQAIWHSPLRRAIQTAAAIHEAREADTPMRPLDALTELSQGEWEGLTHDQVDERYPQQLAAWRDDPLANHAPGGESLAEALERARAAAATILGDPGDVSSEADAAATPAEPVLNHGRTLESDRMAWSIVVAHDGILRLLMLDLLGVPIKRFWSFPFALASVSVLDLSAGAVRLRAHNLDEHIAALAR